MDLATAPHPLDQHGQSKSDQNIEPIDGDVIFEEEEGGAFKSAKEG
jgi:hypothetical protein